MSKLEVSNLFVSVKDRKILNGLSFTIQDGDIIAVMGPNGNGKSTLLKAIMGHPQYTVSSGDILVEGQSILEEEVDERARRGIFLGVQNPHDVPGVLNVDFMRAALSANRATNVDVFEMFRLFKTGISELKLPHDTAERAVNEGFSGGERKKNEILQMQILKPKIVMLDEIDSGLDVDALALISEKLKEYMSQNNAALLLVSHYERLFKMITPTKCIVIVDGRIALSGGAEIVAKIDKDGYD